MLWQVAREAKGAMVNLDLSPVMARMSCRGLIQMEVLAEIGTGICRYLNRLNVSYALAIGTFTNISMPPDTQGSWLCTGRSPLAWSLRVYSHSA
jgi:hypothetical protein